MRTAHNFNIDLTFMKKKKENEENKQAIKANGNDFPFVAAPSKSYL